MKVSRRGFVKTGMMASSFLFLPGIGRVKASPYLNKTNEDYTGRLCYNENPLGPSSLAVNGMEEAMQLSHRYPDIGCATLEADIATQHNINPDTISVGAGATEIIQRVARTFLGPGDEMITATPTYFQMESEAATLGADVVYVPLKDDYSFDLDAISEAITPSTKLISIVNPNNPTGTITPIDKLQEFIFGLPEGIVMVVDEAYYHYAEGVRNYASCINFVKFNKPVVVIRTFSKVYGLAGERIGYSIAPPSLTTQISSTEWSGAVGNVSQAAAIAALNDEQHRNDTIALNNISRNYLIDEITNLGLEYIPSETNFLMINLGRSGSSVVSALAGRGFQVRSGWDMENYIRVSTGTQEEMAQFVTALTQVLNNTGVNESVLPGSFSMDDPYPNPFNSMVNIKINLPESGKTSLVIYDTLGRKVRTIINDNLSAGSKTVKWDGKDSSGRETASGTYLVTVMQNEHVQSKKIMMVK